MSMTSKLRSPAALALRLAVAGALGVASTGTWAASVTLCATPYLQNLPGPNNTTVAVPMWGYSLGACGAAAPSSPGPVLVVPPGDSTLTVTLQNNLTVPTSLVLAGQRLPDGGAPVRAADVVGPACAEPSTDTACRVRSFTAETPPGGTGVYTFSNLRPGSYLYQSGTHQQVQVQMGLFGLMAQDGQAVGATQRQLTRSPASLFDADVPVVLSEIDPDQHARIQATLGSTVLATQQGWQANKNSTLDYAPRYFLVNGKPYDAAGATDLPVSTFSGGYVALRLANAGLRSRSLVLNNGHWQLLTEDGGDYPAPREQYTVLLPAGKTTDARLFMTSVPGRLAFFDRRGGTDNANGDALGGQVAQVVVSSGGTAPTNVADLAITKTDGQTSVFVGDAVTYTIVVTNNGPNAVAGAAVTDVVPANLAGVTWTCVASAGASCAAAGGTGNIASTVNLAVGASATFSLSGTVIGAAGSLVNTASVAAPGGMVDRLPLNNSATDSTAVQVRTADLSVSKTNSVSKVAAGGTLSYTIVASNAASSNVPVSTTVTDTAPAGIVFGSWTCTATAGSSCPATGTGNLNAAVTLAQGGSATFTVNATVSLSAASGSSTNTASIATPANVTDPVPGNNVATDSGVTVVGLPSAAALDNFNRANANNLGGSWNQFAVLGVAGVRVNSNQALALAAGSAYWNLAFGDRQWAAMTVANATFANDALVLKATNLVANVATSFIRVRIVAGGVEVSTVSGLTTTTATLTGAAASFANGNRLTAAVDAAGTVFVWKTAGATTTLVGSVQLAGDPAWTTGNGRIGLSLPAGARVDDFAGGNLP
jgi:uncharacterized repeat protein (TIGR01451 family)